MPRLTQLQTVQLHSMLSDSLKSLPNGLVEYVDNSVSDRAIADRMDIPVGSVVHMRHTLFGRLENTSKEYIEALEKQVESLKGELAKVKLEVIYLYDFLRIKPNGGHKQP